MMNEDYVTIVDRIPVAIPHGNFDHLKIGKNTEKHSTNETRQDLAITF
jgi:hypothetical protein